MWHVDWSIWLPAPFSSVCRWAGVKTARKEETALLRPVSCNRRVTQCTWQLSTKPIDARGHRSHQHRVSVACSVCIWLQAIQANPLDHGNIVSCKLQSNSLLAPDERHSGHSGFIWWNKASRWKEGAFALPQMKKREGERERERHSIAPANKLKGTAMNKTSLCIHMCMHSHKYELMSVIWSHLPSSSQFTVNSLKVCVCNSVSLCECAREVSLNASWCIHGETGECKCDAVASCLITERASKVTGMHEQWQVSS